MRIKLDWATLNTANQRCPFEPSRDWGTLLMEQLKFGRYILILAIIKNTISL